MKKLNKKGFLLAEAIVVGVFILTLFTVLFSNIVPMFGYYEANLMYDDIDSIYKIHLIRNMILIDSDIDSSSDAINQIFGRISSTYGYYSFSNDNICNYLKNKNYCKTLLSEDYLNVKSIVVTTYNTQLLKNSLKSITLPRTVENYIEEMQTYNSPTSYKNYKRLIVEFNDGHVANLEIRVVCGKTDLS